MSRIDTESPSDGLAITASLVPVRLDRTAVKWDDCDASLPGILHEIGLYFERVGLFQPLFEFRAVSLHTGQLAVDNPSTVLFAKGSVADVGSAAQSASGLASAARGRGRDDQRDRDEARRHA